MYLFATIKCIVFYLYWFQTVQEITLTAIHGKVSYSWVCSKPAFWEKRTIYLSSPSLCTVLSLQRKNSLDTAMAHTGAPTHMYVYRFFSKKLRSSYQMGTAVISSNETEVKILPFSHFFCCFIWDSHYSLAKFWPFSPDSYSHREHKLPLNCEAQDFSLSMQHC